MNIDEDGCKAIPLNVQVKNNIAYYMNNVRIKGTFQRIEFKDTGILKAIDYAAYKYLKNKKCLLAAEMFHHGLYGNGKALSGDTLRFLKTRIRTSKTVNKLLSSQLKKANNKKKFFLPYIKEEKIVLNSKAKMILIFIIRYRRLIVYLSVIKNLIENVLTDTYDFTDFSRTLREGITVGNLANDFGVVLQKTKCIKSYKIFITHNFTITV